MCSYFPASNMVDPDPVDPSDLLLLKVELVVDCEVTDRRDESCCWLEGKSWLDEDPVLLVADGTCATELTDDATEDCDLLAFLAIARIAAMDCSSIRDCSCCPVSLGKMKSMRGCGWRGAPRGAFRGIIDGIVLCSKNRH